LLNVQSHSPHRCTAKQRRFGAQFETSTWPIRLLLHGFNVGGDPKHFFPPMPADKVAVGFLTPDTTPAIVMQAMDYIITGAAPPGTTYKLRNPAGYPGMIGAMFWTINDDRRQSYNYSNTVGPRLHSFPRAR
jgi:hypothetical protein